MDIINALYRTNYMCKNTLWSNIQNKSRVE